MPETFEFSTLLPALPEIVLVVGAMVLLMIGAFSGERAAKGVDVAAIVLLIVTGLIVVWLPAGKLVTFGGSFVVDDFARFLKLLALTGSAAAILMSLNYLAAEKQRKFEYSILILLSTTGMLMLISAADLIALYLGLELMSLALYVVAAINRNSLRSTEAGLKYFVLGALSSGHAALWRVADLRIYRHGELRRHRQGGQPAKPGAGIRAGVPVRRLLLQDFGGAVPHVDARRL